MRVPGKVLGFRDVCPEEKKMCGARREDGEVVQFSSVAQLCPTLCNPMDCSTPGLPVHRQLPEFTQTHIH